MTQLLIVDADLLERERMVKLLAAEGHHCHVMTRGQDALARVRQGQIDAVLTELMLIDMSGLYLVEWLREHHPNIPTVLITGRGNEDIAAEALQKGACSYIPKRRMAQDLLRTVHNILGLKTADRRSQHLAHCRLGVETRFRLDNTVEVLPPLVAHLQDQLQLLRFGDESTLMRIGVALTEALENAIYHGNLELDSQLRKGDGQAWIREHQRRRGLAPYRERHVDVVARLSRELCDVTIRDEGPGFDPGKLPDPTDVANLEMVSGRGVYLIRMLMDDVTYSDRGNEIRMIKHWPERRPPTEYASTSGGQPRRP
jgi:DNA-binding response OmpR family regulator